MSIWQALEMVSMDGGQFEEVMEGVAGVDRLGNRTALTAEALLPAPVVFDVFPDQAAPAGVSAHTLFTREGESPRVFPVPRWAHRAMLETGGFMNKETWRQVKWGMTDDFFDVEEWGE